MPEWKTILLTVHENVATVTMNRPEQFNALNVKLAEDLAAALGFCQKSNPPSGVSPALV